MADIADIAQDRMEVELARSLAAVRAAPRELEPTCECHFCFNPTALPTQLFCDAECAEDYQRLKFIA